MCLSGKRGASFSLITKLSLSFATLERICIYPLQSREVMQTKVFMRKTDLLRYILGLFFCGMCGVSWAQTIPPVVVDAKSKLALIGVGYPKADAEERVALADAIRTSEADGTFSEDETQSIAAALAAYEASPHVQLPEDGKVYRLAARMIDGTLCYVYRDGIHGKCSEAPVEDNNGCFIAQRTSATPALTLAGVEDDLYRLVSCVSDAWFTQGAGFNTTTVATLKFQKGENFGTLRITAPYLESAKLKMRTYVALKQDGVFKLNFYTRNANEEYVNVNELETSDFVFEEASDWYFPAKVNDGSLGDFGTLHLPFASVVPEGVTAYALELSAENDHWLEQVRGITSGNILPAETPVLLQGDAPGIYKFYPAASQDTEPLPTGLKGTLAATRIDDNVNAYILAFQKDVGSEIMFYRLDDNDRVIGANKAYWVPGQALSILSLRLGSGGATGIEGSLLATPVMNAPVYDLSGRCVLQLQKGGVYISAGRKYIVK